MKLKHGDKVKPRDPRSSFHPMIGEVTATNHNGTALVDFPGHWSVPFPKGTLVKVKPNAGGEGRA